MNLIYYTTNWVTWKEGIQDAVPYKDKLDRLYEYLDISQKSSIEPELLHSALYFYTDKVYHGLNPKKSTQWNGIYPKKTIVWYVSRPSNRSKSNKQRWKGVLSQYFLLKNALKKYRQIEQKRRLENNINNNIKSFDRGDSSNTIAQIRQRLFISGDLSKDSKVPYDKGCWYFEI
jgi:hypothetical protein